MNKTWKNFETLHKSTMLAKVVLTAIEDSSLHLTSHTVSNEYESQILFDTSCSSKNQMAGDFLRNYTLIDHQNSGQLF